MREWWISPDYSGDMGEPAIADSPEELCSACQKIHVIEYTAYEDLEYKNDDLQHKLERYKKALKIAGECGHGALQTKIMELEDELSKTKAELWVAKDSALRTYDGLAQKADKADALEISLKELQEQFDAVADHRDELEAELAKLRKK